MGSRCSWQASRPAAHNLRSNKPKKIASGLNAQCPWRDLIGGSDNSSPSRPYSGASAHPPQRPYGLTRPAVPPGGSLVSGWRFVPSPQCIPSHLPPEQAQPNAPPVDWGIATDPRRTTAIYRSRTSSSVQRWTSPRFSTKYIGRV